MSLFPGGLELDMSGLPQRLHLGTSSFSSADWVGPFYPPGSRPADFLGEYAARLRTVEIDATWHALPAVRTVESWARRVPDHFVFSLKVPKTISHELYLEGCEGEWTEFLRALEPLGEKRGPLVLQFPYVYKQQNPEEWETGADFCRRLARFLEMVPKDVRLVVEVRNDRWVAEPLLDLLRKHGAALALVEYYTMPSGPEVLQRVDAITSDFAYARLLGNHREMDLMVAKARQEGLRKGDWESLIVDREAETQAWVPAVQSLLGRNLDVFVYFNNHFAGFAPGSLDLFLRCWRDGVA
ncbi:MAG: DUF72 domain-containing protein [Candidatus Eisenbacteria bacterium]